MRVRLTVLISTLSVAFVVAALAAPSGLAAPNAQPESPPQLYSGTNPSCPYPATSSGDATTIDEGNGATAAQLTSVCYGYGLADVNFPAGATFSQLTTLSTSYTMTEGACGGGAPRFEVDLNDADQDFFWVYFGTPPDYTCSPNTLNSADAVTAGLSTAAWYVDYSNTPETYAQVEATYGSDLLADVQIVEDGGWSQPSSSYTQQALIQNWNVNGTVFYPFPGPTPPSVAVTTVNGAVVGSPYSTDQPITSVGGTCSTATGDLPTVSVTVVSTPPGGAVGTTSSYSTSCDVFGRWTLAFSPALSAPGTYTFVASQSDATGDTGVSGTQTVIVGAAPVVSLTQVNGSTVAFPFTTSGTVASVGGACGVLPGDASTVNVTLNGGTPTPVACTGGSWTLEFSWPLYAAGSDTFVASQSDAAGNTGTSGSETVTITATVTPGYVCWLTGQDVESSSKYQGNAGTLANTKANLLVSDSCDSITAIAQKTSVAKRQTLIDDYDQDVQKLEQQGWLTSSQATALETYANQLL